MTRSDVTLCSWNSPAPLAGNTGLSVQVCMCPPNSPVELTTEFVDWCRNVCTLYKHLSAIPAQRCDQRLEPAPHWHVGNHITKRHQRRSWSMEKASLYEQAWRQMTPLSTSAKLKPDSFQSQHTTQPALFRATNSLQRKTRCSAPFPSQLFKTNKVSKEWWDKVSWTCVSFLEVSWWC